MKETTPDAMPPCFEKWCSRFDDVFSHQAQKKGFRHYLGGLLGESERKNLTQMSNNAVGVVYHQWEPMPKNKSGFIRCAGGAQQMICWV